MPNPHPFHAPQSSYTKEDLLKSSKGDRGDVKFRGHITPDARRVRYEVDMRQVRRGRLALGIADGRVLADHICVYVARDMSVGLIAAAI